MREILATSHSTRGRHWLRCLSITAPLVLTACSSTFNTPSTPAAYTANDKQLPVLPAAGSGRGGYYKDDGPGDQPPDGLLDAPDAAPKIEPYFKATSRPYTIFGKTYTPITDNRPFKQRGIGSWYGKKFHNSKTSSGELYDMYKMTAAHPTLPIPSYVRVTNIKTGSQVILRINDRGPFHSNRIIDLSYTAALKLGYLSSGSSELEVERILPDEITRIAQSRRNDITSQTSTTLDGGFYLQLGSYTQKANAHIARDKLMQGLSGIIEKLETIAVNGLYRLYTGPYPSRPAAQNAAQLIRQHSDVAAFIVKH
ncbi:MAG: septal ring lytic transglycosylase RlpA family protein [Herbaspirillum sp.]